MLKTKAGFRFLGFLLGFIAAVLISDCGAVTGNSANNEQLFSPTIGQRFYETAYELAHSQEPSSSDAEQAMILLMAAGRLDNTDEHTLSEMLKVASRGDISEFLSKVADTQSPSSQQLHSAGALVYYLLGRYINSSADSEITEMTVSYLLDQIHSREQREIFLTQMLKELGGRSSVLDSQLATLLGLLKAEKADLQGAGFNFQGAYNTNRYNRIAFSKLSEIDGDKIEPEIYLAHFRFMLRENPLDIEAATAFAGYLEQMQLHAGAADAYRYCAELFEYLFPATPLPMSIYRPWAASCYSSRRYSYKCTQIAEKIHKSNRFDIMLESIAAKAADRMQAERLLKAAEEKAIANSLTGSTNRKTKNDNLQSLAWFYCFARPDAPEALDWANKAYSADPNSTKSAAILAYALVMNQQHDWAVSIIDNYPNNPIADLVMAEVELSKDQKSSAFAKLKSVIASQAGPLETERAKQLLTEHGGEYIKPIANEAILTKLTENFGSAVVPEFVRPEKLISIQLNLRGSKFSYGSGFGGSVTITNNSSEPLILSNNGLFTGKIRIDADIQGDLNIKIPQLVSMSTRPVSAMQPGQSLLIPVRLNTGELREILLSHPQASLDIEFSVFIDPIVTEQGEVFNRLMEIKPAKVVVKRPGVELNRKYLQNRLSSISKGIQGPKIKTSRLFTGLLAEQHAIANLQSSYPLNYADWMPALLKSALTYNLASDDWVVKVDTMLSMLRLPLDYELTSAAAKNLHDPRWPVRMTAIYLMAKNSQDSFSKVLNWTAQYDTNRLVREMAIALGGTVSAQVETGQIPSAE